MRPSFGWPTSSVASPAPKTRSGAVLDQLAPARTSVLLTHEQPVGRPDPASATALPTADPTPPGSTSKLVDVGVCRTSLFQKYFLRAVRAGVRTPRVQTVRCTRPARVCTHHQRSRGRATRWVARGALSKCQAGTTNGWAPWQRDRISLRPAVEPRGFEPRTSAVQGRRSPG
jgi:hypothetical protein